MAKPLLSVDNIVRKPYAKSHYIKSYFQTFHPKPYPEKQKNIYHVDQAPSKFQYFLPQWEAYRNQRRALWVYKNSKPGCDTEEKTKSPEYFYLLWFNAKQYFENLRIINYKKYLYNIIENKKFFNRLYFLNLFFFKKQAWLFDFFLKLNLKKRWLHVRYRRHQKLLKSKRNFYKTLDEESDTKQETHRSNSKNMKAPKMDPMHLVKLYSLLENNLFLYSFHSDGRDNCIQNATRKIKPYESSAILWQRDLHAELYGSYGFQDNTITTQPAMKNEC